MTRMKGTCPSISPPRGETASTSARSSRSTATAADSPASRARTQRESRSTTPDSRSKKRSSVNAVTMPAMLLSGLMLPMTLAPGWLDALSHLMPFRYLVDAVRAGYVGDYASTAMLHGSLVALGFAVLGVTAGTRVFRKAGA
ncbi:ABC transporter permease [Streptomyces sp. FIT100]|nr:ABC transporter permease [Streptomyces sp. FIT100]